MANRIKLVQGDTYPQINVTIYDEATGKPTDLRQATVLLKFRETGSTTIRSTLTGSLTAGFTDENGNTVYNPAPYDEDGGGGGVVFSWDADDLDVAGSFEGEVEVTFPNNRIQTVYDVVRFQIREQF